MNRSYFRIILIGLGAIISTASFADRAIIYNEITYPKPTTQQSVNESMARVQNLTLIVNNKKTVNLLSSYVKQKTGYIPVTLQAGDQVQVKLQAMDGKWYHTNTFVYGASKSGASIISISGTYLPLHVKLNGKIVSNFYNEDDWVSFDSFCGGVAGGAGYFYCTFDSYYGSAKYKIQGPSGGLSAGFGGGTAYLDTDYLNSHLHETYSLIFTGIIFYSHLNIANPNGTMVGYGNYGGVSVGVTYTVGKITSQESN